MPSTYRGTFVPQLQRQSIRFSQTDGYTREYDWKGFDGNRILQYADAYARAGCDYEYNAEKGIYTLHAVDSTGQVVLDTWEMGLSQLRPSILNHPTVLYILENSGSSATVVRGIQQALQDPNLAYADIEDLDPVDAADEDTLFAFLDLHRNSEDTFRKSSYVLRHTTNAPNRWGRNVSDLNVDAVYTTAQMLSEVQNANSWYFPLPGRLAYKIQTLEVPDTRANRLVGWLKSGSPESTASNQRINIQTEYEYGQWSTLIYGTV